MPDENEQCPDCQKPLEENHVCWGQSSDFAVVTNIPEEEPAPKPIKNKDGAVKKKVGRPKINPDQTQEKNKKAKKRGRKKIDDGLTAQQRWTKRNQAKVNLYQRNLMRKRRKEAKAEKAAEAQKKADIKLARERLMAVDRSEDWGKVKKELEK